MINQKTAMLKIEIRKLQAELEQLKIENEELKKQLTVCVICGNIHDNYKP